MYLLRQLHKVRTVSYTHLIFVILFGVINIYELLRAKEVKPLSAKKETVISNKSAVVQKAIVKGDK